MSINKTELYNFLHDKNYRYLYHANTVVTSCSFIEQGGLLSRKETENRNLNQTPQDSDKKDKILGVYNDIFVDVLNLGQYYNRINYYGPICFVMSIDMLLDENLPDVHITVNNPIYITNPNNMYYNDVNDYINVFSQSLLNHTIQQKMITFKNCNDIIPFNPYLKEIIIEQPYFTNDIIQNGLDTIKKCIQNNNINAQIKHVCRNVNDNRDINPLFNPNYQEQGELL